MLDRRHRLGHRFDRDAIIGYLALGLDRLKRVIDRGVGIDRCWRAVQLHKVKAIDAQIGQAAVDEGFDIGARVALGGMG